MENATTSNILFEKKQRKLDENKKKRASNWTPEMIQLLVSLIKPLIDIIDSKTNNLAMIKKKSEAWAKVKEAFDANGYQASIKQLRDLWNRRKQLARNRISTFNNEQRLTGGGSPPKEPSDGDYEIQEIAKDDFVQDFSVYDCDADYVIPQNEIRNETPNNISVLETLVIEEV